jgi:predicted DNA-binding transcriptional regulator AlpA
MGKEQQDYLSYPPRGLRVEGAAAYIGMGKTKFLELVQDGRMPKPIKMDTVVVWDRFELDAAFDDLRDKRIDPIEAGRQRLNAILDEQERQRMISAGRERSRRGAR